MNRHKGSMGFAKQEVMVVRGLLTIDLVLSFWELNIEEWATHSGTMRR
jgi:hypothetical protein